MRLRRKKNLEERMESVAEIMPIVEGARFYDKAEEDKYNLLDLGELFGNSNPVYLELGCGKGLFCTAMAKKYPEVNFIAVEKVSNVIISACERAKEEGVENVRFFNCNAEVLKYFLKKDSISGMYLNFSCPYPKSTYANSRMTHHRFLTVYKGFLKKGAIITQKTDSAVLFEFSLEQFSKNGFALQNISLDLHDSKFAKDNVMTEYEKNFIRENKKIFRCEAVLK